MYNLKEKNLSAIESFYKHCRQFSKRFMIRETIIINEYQIKRHDIHKDIFKHVKFEDEDSCNDEDSDTVNALSPNMTEKS